MRNLSWQSQMGDLLGASPVENPAPLIKDKYAISITDESGRTVGHVPTFLAKIVKVNGARRHSSAPQIQNAYFRRFSSRMRQSLF